MIGVDKQRAEHAAVGDGEGAALHLVDGQRAFLGALAEVGDRLLDLGEAHRLGVANDRNDQALGRGHRDRDVEIIVIDDLVAVDAGVDRGHVARGERAGLHEEAHEAKADAVLLLEQVLVAGARLDHRRHVDVVERGQHRRGVLRFLEPRGDRLAQARHLHALFAALAVSPATGRGRQAEPGARRRRRFRLRRLGAGLRWTGLLRLGRGDHVVLGQPPVLAACRWILVGST